VLISFSNSGRTQLFEDRIIVKNLYELFRLVRSKRKSQSKE